MAGEVQARDGETVGHKISVGDISGSVAAIGAGAQAIYQNVERALTEVEIAEQLEARARKHLAESVTAYVHRLERQARRAQQDPGMGSPYKALLEYDIQDTALFFGRSADVGSLLEHVQRDQLTVLHAESGAGKTSLLKAGIMPRLLAGGHLPLYIRPYQTPVHQAIKDCLVPQSQDSPRLAATSLHDFLCRVTDLLGGQQMVVIVDQFEELFTVQGEEDRSRFVTELSPCLADDLLPVRWILALRGEWLSHLGTFRPQIRNPFANEVLLRALSREQARDVIVEPALRRGVTYEPLLVDRLLRDLGQDEISPPQLQLVCSALFEARDGQSQITAALYDQTGSAGGILRGHLDRVLRRDILPGQRQAARRLLEALVTAEKRRALRPRDDLGVELARQGVDEATLDAMLVQLVDGRLLRVEERGEGAALAYELAHDYLLEEIQLDPAAQARKAAQELLAQKLPYYARDGLLLSADELAIINPQRQWLALSDEAGRLLRESQAAVARRKRLTMGAIVVAAALILAAILAAVLIQSSAVQEQANLQGTAAAEQAIIASTAMAAQDLAARSEEEAMARLHAVETAQAQTEAEQAVSRSQELAARALLALESESVSDAYSLAIYAHKTSPTVESQRTLYTVLQSPLPERALNSPQGAIVDASFGPDGKRIVSAGGSGGTAVWDADTGEKLVGFQGDTEAVTSARFSPDGSRIVTAGADDVARVWDANTGQQLLVLEGHTNDVLSASFSPDGLRIVTSGGEYAWLCDTECDQTARVWDANSGEQLLVLEGHTDRVSSAAFARYEPYIVTASWDKTARVWDSQTGQELARLEGDTRGLTFASFGRSTWLVTASADTTAHVVDFWAVDQIRELAILRGHTDILTSAQFSPDDLQIVTASHDRTARIWETLSGRQLAVLTGHSGVVQSAGFSPDGTRIVTVSAGSALIWRHADRKAEVGRHNLTALLAGFGDFRLSPDFQYLAAAKYDHTVTAWDLATGRRLARLAGHQDRITAMGFSHDGRRLATASKDGTLRLWDVHSGAELVAVSHGHGDEVVSVAFSADDTRLVTASEDNSARVWDAGGGEPLAVLAGHEIGVATAAFSPDGSRVVTGCGDGLAYVWDVDSGEALMVLRGHSGGLHTARFSADGRRIVTAGNDRTAAVWDAESGARLAILRGHGDTVSAADLSSDGTHVVTASWDGTVRIWDAESGTQVALMEGHTGYIESAGFSADGRTIVTTSLDQTVRVWPGSVQEALRLAEERLAALGIRVDPGLPPNLRITPPSGLIPAYHRVDVANFQPWEVVGLDLVSSESGRVVMSTTLTMNAIGSGMFWLLSETEDLPGVYLVVAEGQAGSSAQGELVFEAAE